jgi:hypothetical protein
MFLTSAEWLSRVKSIYNGSLYKDFMADIGTALKTVIGIVLIAVGVWSLLPAYMSGLGLWSELWTLVRGAVPAVLVFVGAMLVWVEVEEFGKRRKRR